GAADRRIVEPEALLARLGYGPRVVPEQHEERRGILPLQALLHVLRGNDGLIVLGDDVPGHGAHLVQPSGAPGAQRRERGDECEIAEEQPDPQGHAVLTKQSWVAYRFAEAFRADRSSRSRFSRSTLTLGSPRNPNSRFSIRPSTSCRTAFSSSSRAFATRGTWNIAASGEMCGSKPDADVVTRSIGTSPPPGLSLRAASTAV